MYHFRVRIGKTEDVRFLLAGMKPRLCSDMLGRNEKFTNQEIEAQQRRWCWSVRLPECQGAHDHDLIPNIQFSHWPIGQGPAECAKRLILIN